LVTRDDLLPQYREDLTEKAARVRQVILNLPDQKIPSLKDVSTADYNLIRLAVINSIKGEAIAHEERTRQKWVERIFLSPAKKQGLLTYKDVSGTGKCDFEGDLKTGIHFGLEVKGGEGNSVTLLSRPKDAKVHCVWSHLDVMSNTPADNMRAVLGRVVKQMVNSDEKKQKVDYLVFYDKWYLSGIKRFNVGEPLPDVIVFPKSIPTKKHPIPRMRDPGKSPFLRILYHVTGKGLLLKSPIVRSHIWLCALKVSKVKGKWYRQMEVRNWQYPKISLSEKAVLTTSVKVITSL
jgi:hypothetical protein